MNFSKKQLKRLRNIHPTDTWVDSRWEVLSERLGAETKQLSFGEQLICIISHPRLIKPMANAFAAVVVLVVGSWGMVASAQHTTHGDTLYPLKQVIERVSIALTRDDSARIEKQTAIASTRVRELKSLVVRQELSGDASGNIDKTVRDLKRELETTQEIFVAAKQSNNKNGLARTAALVEEHANDLAREITQAREQLPEDVDATVSSDIKAASTLAENTSTEALEVIITNGLGDSSVSEDIILERLSERVAQAEKYYTDINAMHTTLLQTYQTDLASGSIEADEQYADDLTAFENTLDDIAVRFERFSVLFETKDYLGVLQTTLQIKSDLADIESALTLMPTETQEVIEDDNETITPDELMEQGVEVLPVETDSPTGTESTLKNKF